MRIGQLATRAGVNIQTIRFYERRRILSAPPRSISGYRQYAEADLDELRIIRRCKELGFTLKEIQQLLGLHRATTTLPINGRRPAEFRKIAELGRRRLEQYVSVR
jgi:MerR family transcriptional regulator, copper efflux regulator